jgi:DeoR/GlpR family transcriptional regulator of sugar metabolism
LKRAAVAHARQVVILAENQKFQKKTPYLVAAWPDVDVLITDQAPAKEEHLPDTVEVMVAPPKG